MLASSATPSSAVLSPGDAGGCISCAAGCGCAPACFFGAFDACCRACCGACCSCGAAARA
jgi:hypothetical protein